jgi:hypothetical protein
MKYDDWLKHGDGTRTAPHIFRKVFNHHILTKNTVMTIDEALSRFKDGHERYNSDAFFRMTVEALVRGQDPIHIIDVLLSNHKELTEQFNDLLKNGTKHTIVIETEGEARKLLEQMKWSEK